MMDETRKADLANWVTGAGVGSAAGGVSALFFVISTAASTSSSVVSGFTFAALGGSYSALFASTVAIGFSSLKKRQMLSGMAVGLPATLATIFTMHANHLSKQIEGHILVPIDPIVAEAHETIPNFDPKDDLRGIAYNLAEEAIANWEIALDNAQALCTENPRAAQSASVDCKLLVPKQP